MSEVEPPVKVEQDSGDQAKELEFVIDQSQKVAAIYDGRRTDADGNATTILGYAISLATLTVTSSALLNPSKGFAIAAAVATGVSAALAVWARLGAGLHAGPRLVRSDASPGAPRLVISHESDRFDDAHRDFENLGADHPVEARTTVLELWRAREGDLHHIAQQKERFVAGAGIMLTVSVVLVAIVGISLVHAS